MILPRCPESAFNPETRAHVNQIRLNQTSEHYSYTFCAPLLSPSTPCLLNQIRLNQTSEHYSYTFCAPGRRGNSASWFKASVDHRPLTANGECKGTAQAFTKVCCDLASLRDGIGNFDFRFPCPWSVCRHRAATATDLSWGLSGSTLRDATIDTIFVTALNHTCQ